MLFDEVRNTAYARAIQATITPGCSVLDLGAGLGIHGLLAAAAGAGRVILLDPSPVVDLGLELARDNGLAEQVEVIRKRVEEVDTLGPVDVIISVFTGNFLLSEDLLPSLFLARDRFLQPGGLLIPNRARMLVAPVSVPEFFSTHIARWSTPTVGIDFSRARQFAGNTVYYRSLEQLNAELLGEATELLDMDFSTCQVAECHSHVNLTAHKGGTCHGLLGWFEILLGDSWLSTGPEATPLHWSVAFLPVDPPLELAAGDTIGFELKRPQFGEWTWTVTHGGRQQRHSTFQANIVDLAQIKKLAPDAAPGLQESGELALHVLSCLAEGGRVGEIIESARQRFPRQAIHEFALEQMVRNLVVRWGGKQK